MKQSKPDGRDAYIHRYQPVKLIASDTAEPGILYLRPLYSIPFPSISPVECPRITSPPRVLLLFLCLSFSVLLLSLLFLAGCVYTV